MSEDRIDIVHNEPAGRYELHSDDRLASLVTYRRKGRTMVLDHTETLPPFQGRGFAERLVRFALDDVRARGLKVVAACWFVADVIEANPEYSDLVAA